MSLAVRPNNSRSLSGTRHIKSPLEHFKIELDSKDCKCAYAPGQIISGKVIIENSGFVVCSSVRVVLEGLAVVTYLAGKSGRNKIENLLPYEWATVYLVGTSYQCSEKLHLLKKSRHEYPFKIPIRKLDPFPGTLKGVHGEIEYRVAAYIDNANASSQIPNTVFRPIKVKGYLNLRALPTLAFPTVHSGKLTLPNSNEEINFSLHLSRTSFLPWEEIPFKLTLIDPLDKDNLPKVCISLVRKINFKSDVSARCIKTILSMCESSRWNFLDKKTAEWNDSLYVPEEAKYPTFIGGIIEFIYALKVELKMDICPIRNVGEIPITIGTTRQK